MGTPEQDALRRDLTINSMFYNLHTRKIEDFTGKVQEDRELLRKLGNSGLEGWDCKDSFGACSDFC